MTYLRDLIGTLAFRTRAVRGMEERRAWMPGLLVFVLGFLAYAWVRNSVYAVLQSASPGPQNALEAFLDLNLLQSLLFLLAIYIPVLILGANSVAADGVGVSLSRQEYRAHAAVLLPLWGIGSLVAAPVQWLAPHFLIIGGLEISVGMLIRLLLLCVYTLWAIQRLNYLGITQTLCVCALSCLTFPAYYVLTAYVQAIPIFILIACMPAAYRWLRSSIAARAQTRVSRQSLQALASNPQDAKAHYQLGLVHLARGNPAAAQGYFASAVRIAPQKPEYHYGFGRACALKGAWPEALEHYEEAHRIDPDCSRGDLMRAMGKAYVHAGCAEKGRELLDSFLARRDSDPEGRYWYAVALRETGEAELARFQLTRILEQARVNPRGFRKRNREWIHRARVLLRAAHQELPD